MENDSKPKAPVAVPPTPSKRLVISSLVSAEIKAGHNWVGTAPRNHSNVKR